MEYKGTWNAATNTPTLANGTGDTGDVYICNVAGTVNFGAGPLTFAVGDYVIYSGTIWQRSSGAVGTVTSVGLSITGDAIGVSNSPITTSGTLALAFAGNSTQYINGAGNLVTFPGIVSQAQNLITEVYNKTGATLTKGTVVYINGGQGNLPTITKAIATGDSTSAQTYGIVQQDITNNNNGFVVAAGRITDLDTQAYTDGTQLYLSSTTAGTYTSTKQYAPAHLVYVGIVVRAHPTQGVVEVKIQNGYEMDELHNVSAQTPTNNDGLFWESSTSLWKNKSIATILGYTPQAQLNGTGFVKASGTSITYDNSTYVTTDTFQTISASKTFSVGLSLASAGGTNQITSFVNTNSIHSGSTATNVLGFNNSNNIYFGKGLNNGGVITFNNAAVRFYALPDADGTIALVGGSGVGTVTSVGLSSATSGVTIGSTPITTSGTITLAIATASGSQQGLLSSTDWTTFNNKQNALTNPVTGTGTTNYLPKFTGASTIGNSVIQEASGSIGINVSPVADFQVGKSSGVTIAMSNSSSVTSGMRGGLAWYNSNVSTVAAITAVAVTDNVGTQLEFYTRPVGGSLTQAMTLNASGNLGLGVTPSAGGLSGYVLFELGNGGASIYSGANQNLNGTNISWSGGTASYKISNFATVYNQQSGQHQWYNAPSGTAGNAISFTQAMTLNASGNLSLGNTNDTYKLDVTGTGRFSGKLIGATAGFSNRVTVGTDSDQPYVALGIFGSISSGADQWSFITDNALSGTSTSTAIMANAKIKASTAVTRAVGINITDAEKGSGATITNNYGLYINNQTAGSTLNYSIYTAGGLHYFGGAATFSSSVTAGGNLGASSDYTAMTLRNQANGDYYVGLDFSSGTDNGTSSIRSYRTNSAGDYQTALTFWTKGSGAGPTSPTERMRITSAGNVGIGTTSPNAKLYVLGNSTTEEIFYAEKSTASFTGNVITSLTYTASGTGWNHFVGYSDIGSTTNIKILGNGNIQNANNSYGAISDIKLKENITDATSKLNSLLKVKIRNYNLIGDDKKQLGVIAQELETIFPSMIETTNDVDKNGKYLGTTTKSVKYSVFVPMLIKAVQELKQELDTLKNK
jgi:hypothetical protein